MENRSKLLSIEVRNIGCIGQAGASVSLDEIVCLVGRNNAGKSTILNAYELAKGKRPFKPTDRHQHAAEDQPSEVILCVHIPEGIGNVDAKWKVPVGDHLVVKSRWTWSSTLQKLRQTWNPTLSEGAGDWDPEQNASGLDNVFGSRLPEPIRINSLDDASSEQDQLLALALTPLTKELELAARDPASKLAKAVASVQESVTEAAQSHVEHFQIIAQKVATGFKGVFPQLGVNLNLDPAAPPIKTAEMLKAGSQLSIQDGNTTTTAAQQGTGARRALFWAILQVRNEMERDTNSRSDYKSKLEKEIKGLQTAIAKPKKGADPAQAQAELDTKVALLAAHNDGAPLPKDEEDVAFPGYLLLIDEPENALHPMAARAAQRYLYELAKSPDWQVMLTTHSPYFVNPFEDHTTIVRFDRVDDADCLVTRTYRSDTVTFEGDEKQRLQALQQMDPSFSEVFFGSYPVLVEGDTEHAAFIAAATDGMPVDSQVATIRARGKALVVPLIKVLHHFKISFAVLHDLDSPYTSKGGGNGMWTENAKIWRAAESARADGLTVRHRVSTPDFERFLFQEESDKEKPLAAYLNVKGDAELQERVRALMESLRSSEQHRPYEGVVTEDDYMNTARQAVSDWAAANGEAANIRFAGPPPAA